MNIVSSLLDHPPCQTLAGPHTSTTQLLQQLFFSPLPIEVVVVAVVVMLVGGPTSSGASKLASSCGFASRDREKSLKMSVLMIHRRRERERERERERVRVRERERKKTKESVCVCTVRVVKSHETEMYCSTPCSGANPIKFKN